VRRSCRRWREVVLLGAAGLEGGAHLGHLPLAQLAQSGGEQSGDLGAEPRCDGSRARQEVIARHNGDEVAEAAVHGLHVAADGGLVDDVVVVEGREVHQLDGDTTQEVLLGGRTAPAGRRRQGQHGPQALPAGRDQMGGDLVQEPVTGHDRGREQGLETEHVLLERGEAQSRQRIHS